MKAIPLELKEANAFVEQLHRHHKPVHRDKFRIGCLDDNDNLCGVIQLARPVSRCLDDGLTIEAVRCCTDGTYNACSFLYSRAARIAKEMGYSKIITYILSEEQGTSLKASGWECEAVDVGGGTWDRPSRPRELMCDGKAKYSTSKKQRWKKDL